MKQLTRRELLKKSASYSALALVASTGGCELILKRIENRPVRRGLSTLSASDPVIQTYKAAISAMKALPGSDPRNWQRQATIHFDHCPHSNWFFLPWHRAYLVYFERICQQLTGQSDFALPYWNWTIQKSIPPVFGGDSTNPLFDSTRFATMSDTLADEFVGASVVDGILNEPNFLVFASGTSTTQRGGSTYGRLEATPHNNVHGFVGGDMGNFMSPLDPIFWTHHNMIERCWVDWNINRSHANTNDAQWTDFIFAGDFCDENGKSVDIKVATTLLMPLFDYQYDNFTLGSSAGRMSALSAAALKQFVQQGAAVKLEFQQQFEAVRPTEVMLAAPARQSLRVEASAIQAAIAPRANARVFLTLDGVTLPKSSDFFARVFVNKPDATAETPITDAHYAGSFAFFGGDHAAHGESTKPRYLVEVTETLRALQSGGAGLSDSIDVQLVAVPMPHRQPVEIRFGFERLRLGVVKE